MTRNDNDADKATGVTKKVRFADEDDAIETTERNKSRCTKRDHKREDATRRFQHISRLPSEDAILHSVATNGIKNSPITRRCTELAKDMLELSE